MPSDSEQKISIAKKSIHLTKNLSKGMLFPKKILFLYDQGDGVSPMEWENIIGKKLFR
jgi:N-acetylneuraminate synthase/N,N'-diacetyllegionaminate synthase